MKIYTKTGDRGTTSLMGGVRVYKDDIRVETYGSLDELNSVIGIIIALIYSSELIFHNLDIENLLKTIQKDLFLIESNISSPNAKYSKEESSYLDKTVLEFEKLIDKLTEKMPPLKNFILPGGDLISANLHLARTISRRAERIMVKLSKDEFVQKENLIYLNRLSDLFFTLARYVNFGKKIKENIWKK